MGNLSYCLNILLEKKINNIIILSFTLDSKLGFSKNQVVVRGN